MFSLFATGSVYDFHLDQCQFHVSRQGAITLNEPLILRLFKYVLMPHEHLCADRDTIYIDFGLSFEHSELVCV